MQDMYLGILSFLFVTLILSSGLLDPFFNNKKIPFPSTAVYHKNYTENISLTEQFEHLQSYFTLILGFPTWGTCTPGGTFAYPKGYI